jgi:hypothetical protein
MFEIYREAGYARCYRVVYFTELDEHNKEIEISRAMAGEHFYDGFLSDLHKEEGKRRVADLVARLNRGERLGPEDIERELAGLGA